MEAAGLTDVGKVRDNNQDQFLIAELERGLLIRGSSLGDEDGTSVTDSPQGYLLAVADGVGGNHGGDVASAIALDTVAHYALTVMPWVIMVDRSDAKESIEGLQRAIADAQGRMQRIAERRGHSSTMATTFTMAYVTWPTLHVVHVGDSRCYLHRDGELSQLTRDHTMAEEMIRQGVDPQMVRGTRLDHTLSNAVGGGNDGLDVDLYRAKLRSEDQVLLCSDGLTGMVSEEAINAKLCERDPVDQVVHDLVDAANTAGGRDNITAIVARF